MASALHAAVDEAARTATPHAPAALAPGTLAVATGCADSEFAHAGSEQLLQDLAAHALPRVCGLLDVALQRAQTLQTDGAAGGFFALLYAALAAAPLVDGIALVAFLETRREPIAAQAAGAQSVALLRAVRALLDRLHPRLHAEARGRLLQFAALAKGFAHASRLNKRGRVWSPAECDAPAFSPAYYVAAFARPQSLDTTAVQRLCAELNTHQERARDADDLDASAVDVSAVDTDWPALMWEELTRFEVRALAMHAFLAFRSATVLPDAESSVAQLQETCRAIVGELGEHYLDRVVETDDAWRAWKAAQCRRAPPADGALPGDVPLPPEPELPPLAGFGNSRISNLIKTDVSLAAFGVDIAPVTPANEPEAAADAGAQSETANVYNALRKAAWPARVAYFASQGSALDETAIAQRLESLKAAHKAKVAAPESPEPRDVRMRVSYEDAERPRSHGSTLKPLPY